LVWVWVQTQDPNPKFFFGSNVCLWLAKLMLLFYQASSCFDLMGSFLSVGAFSLNIYLMITSN
jgi:uncharacterized membrane protein YeiB